MRVVGLDIGGANIKAAHSGGIARAHAFQLWKNPRQLAAALTAIVDKLPEFDRLAVTMTGELCDCFRDKREGVHFIVDCVTTLFGAKNPKIYALPGIWLAPDEARNDPLRVASANWHALASAVAQTLLPTSAGLLIDIGSTTTDIIPLLEGKPAPQGWSDPARMRTAELVYRGVRRTPVCALLGSQVAAELFATMHDVYLWLGETAEEPENIDTADSRPATQAAAGERLARMLCGDRETVGESEVTALAKMAQTAQTSVIVQAVQKVVAHMAAPPVSIVIAGSGEFLAREVLGKSHLRSMPVISLRDTWGQVNSICACAHALVLLRIPVGPAN